MGVQERATELHLSGFNCAQSVLCSCAPYTGMDDRDALAVSAGFGGGLRCGEVCGAVSGGVMALSLCCPFTESRDQAAKDKIAALAVAYTGAFREHFGTLRCEVLKGDKSRCGEYINFAAQLAETMIMNNQKKGEE